MAHFSAGHADRDAILSDGEIVLVFYLYAAFLMFNIYNFMTCPIERLTQEGQGLSAKKLLSIPLFWVFLLLMIGAGASEASMAQWASAYAESALGFSKTIGDIVGP